MKALPYAPNEAEFQRACTEAAESYGWRWNHTRKARVRKDRFATPTSTSGWPDLVLWHPKHGVWFVELKADNGRVSEAQEDVLNSLCDAGAHVDVWSPSIWEVRVLPILQGNLSDFPLRDSSSGSRVPQRGPNSPAGGAEGLPPAGDPDIAWEVAHERTADAADRGE